MADYTVSLHLAADHSQANSAARQTAGEYSKLGQAFLKAESLMSQGAKQVSAGLGGMQRALGVSNEKVAKTTTTVQTGSSRLLRFNNAAFALQGTLQSLQGSLGASNTLLSQLIANFAFGQPAIGKFGVALAAIYAAGLTIGTQFNAKIEQLNIGFTTLTGSSEKAKVLMEQIIDVARFTPYEVDNLAKSVQTLLAYGIPLNEVLSGTGREAKGLAVDIGNAASATGKGQEALDSLTGALGRVQAKGKMTARETLSFAAAGIPIYQILQEQLHLTSDQIANIGKSGLTAKEILPAISRGIQEHFGNAMEKQSRTAIGLVSTLKDNIQIGLGQAFEAAFNSMKGGLTTITDWLTEFDKLVSKIGFSKALSISVPGLAPLIDGISYLSDQFGHLWREAQPVLAGLAKGFATAFGGLTVATIRVFGSAMNLLAEGLERIPDGLKGWVGAIVGIVAALRIFGSVLHGVLNVEALKKAYHGITEYFGKYTRAIKENTLVTAEAIQAREALHASAAQAMQANIAAKGAIEAETRAKQTAVNIGLEKAEADRQARIAADALQAADTEVALKEENLNRIRQRGVVYTSAAADAEAELGNAKQRQSILQAEANATAQRAAQLDAEQVSANAAITQTSNARSAAQQKVATTLTATSAAQAEANATAAVQKTLWQSLTTTANGVFLALTLVATAYFTLAPLFAKQERHYLDSADAAKTLAKSTDGVWKSVRTLKDEVKEPVRVQIQLTQSDKFKKANRDTIRDIREIRNEVGLATAEHAVLDLGVRLVLRGNSPKEAFSRIQKIADEAGILLPVEYDPEMLNSSRADLNRLAQDQQLVIDRMTAGWKEFHSTVEEGLQGPMIEDKDKLENIFFQLDGTFDMTGFDELNRQIGNIAKGLNGSTDEASRAIIVWSQFESLIGSSGLSTARQKDAMRLLVAQLSEASPKLGRMAGEAKNMDDFLRRAAKSTDAGSFAFRSYAGAVVSLRQQGIPLRTALRLAAQGVGNLNVAQDKGTQIAKNFTKVITLTGDAAKDAADRMDNYRQSTEDFLDLGGVWSATLENQGEDARKSAEDQAIAAGLGAGAWQRFAGDSKQALHEFGTALQNQIEATRAYNRNLIIIAEQYGVEFADWLREQGPEFAGAVNEMVTDANGEAGRLAILLHDTWQATGEGSAEDLRKVTDVMAQVGVEGMTKSAAEIAAEVGNISPEEVVKIVEQYGDPLQLAWADTQRAMAQGAKEAGEAIPENFGKSLPEMEAWANRYRDVILSGVNPVLSALGKPLISLTPTTRGYGGVYSHPLAMGDMWGPVQGEDGQTVNYKWPKRAEMLSRSGKPKVMWAEPETWGESFIPLAPDHRRPRAIEIWRQTGKRLGVKGQYADGGFTDESQIPKPNPPNKKVPWSGWYATAATGAADLYYDFAKKVVLARKLSEEAMAAARRGDVSTDGLTRAALRMIDAVKRAVPGSAVSSGFRPGAITADGNRSDHGFGRAADFVGPLRTIFDFLRSNFYSLDMKQLIYQHINKRTTGESYFPRSDHFDHVHGAVYDKGGMLQPGMNLAYNGTGKPESVFADGGFLYKAALGGLIKADTGYWSAPPVAPTPLPNRSSSGSSSSSSSTAASQTAEQAARDAQQAAEEAARAAEEAKREAEAAEDAAYSAGAITLSRYAQILTARIAGVKALSAEYFNLVQQQRDLLQSAAADLASRFKEEQEIRKSAVEARKTYNKTIRELQEERAKDEEDAQRTYREQIDSAAKAFDDQLRQQTRQIAETMDITKEFKPASFAASIGSLIKNAFSQNKVFEEYTRGLEQLRAAGLSQDVISALDLEKGPEANAQIQQLLKGSKIDIQQLNAAFRERYALAGRAALSTEDIGQAAADRDTQIADARREYADRRVELRKTYLEDIADAKKTYLDEMADLNARLEELAWTGTTNFARAIQDALYKSGIPAMKTAAWDLYQALISSPGGAFMFWVQQAYERGEISGPLSGVTPLPTVKFHTGGIVDGPQVMNTNSELLAVLQRGEGVVSKQGMERLHEMTTGRDASPVQFGNSTSGNAAPVIVTPDVNVTVFMDSEEITKKVIVRTGLGKARSLARGGKF